MAIAEGNDFYLMITCLSWGRWVVHTGIDISRDVWVMTLMYIFVPSCYLSGVYIETLLHATNDMKLTEVNSVSYCPTISLPFPF